MRTINQLNAAKVRTAEPGRHGDGGGLYLEVSKGGGKSWVFMWKRGGKRRPMGLGSAHTISLVEARRLAKDARSHCTSVATCNRRRGDRMKWTFAAVHASACGPNAKWRNVRFCAAVRV
jgi:hypothetical protein